MKNKHHIGWFLAGAAAMFLITHSAAAAADKVVVVPLDGGSGDTGDITTVTSAGQVWMDRNLGALRVATKSDDPKAYGSLYQWGRLGDGHEYRESPIRDTVSSDVVPGHGDFIAGGANGDWTVSNNSNLWQGELGINNPCPAGFRLPRMQEWEDEMDTWVPTNQNAAGAFASPLKLVVAGNRGHNSGTLYNAGSAGHYWSSTVGYSCARTLDFTSGNANIYSDYCAGGLSVRCIKD